MDSEIIIIAVVALLVLVILQSLVFLRQYKKSKPGKTLVITGRVSEDINQKLKITKTQSLFVWPIFQDSFYLDHGNRKVIIEIFLEQKQYNAEVVFRISDDDDLLKISAEKFPKMNEKQVCEFVEPSIIQAINNVARRQGNTNALREIDREISTSLALLGCELVMNKVLKFG